MLSIAPELARSALEAAPDALLIIDDAGVIRFANQQVTTLFGHAHDGIIGQGIERLIPERFRNRHVGHREDYVASVRMRPMGAGLELFGLRQDGSEFPVEISLSPIRDGDCVLIAAAIRDVTERKRTEAELIVARQEAERAREIADQARDSADRANQGKSRFVATASHDLRQPLQTLALLNGALRRKVRNADDAEALEQQEQAIASMSRLLNALLDISKLESGAIRPEIADFPVAALFRELRTEFSSLAATKGLELQVDECAECVRSDPSLVGQILRNIVSNAIKYTRSGSVRLRCLHDAAAIRLEVLDTGVGIPAEQVACIFDEFYQIGVPTNSTRDGYGLGLSIVQRLVKLLKLDLAVQSVVGQGSSFSLALPAGGGRTGAAKVEPAATAGTWPQIARARLLLVEDDASVRNATRLLLKVEGYRVTAVASLAEALQEAQKDEALDLLVTDYHLSDGETGTQVIAAVREMLGRSVKAVLMTGDTSSAIADLPRDPYLRVASKPIKAEELMTLLRALLAL